MQTIFRSLYNKSVILDTNILSDLDEIGALFLPSKIFKTIYISKNIQIEELEEDLNMKVSDLGYLSAHLDTSDGFDKFNYLRNNYPKLSNSDIIVICIAYEKKILCCTNDRRARRACELIGCTTAGTLGILGCAYENNIITFTEFTDLFNNYINISSRLDSSLIESVRTTYNIPILNVL